MDIVLITHHFPPRYNAGGEQYAYRVARGLARMGHAISVVCVESISRGTLTPRSEFEIYEGLPVHRLFFDLEQAPDSFEWSYHNPKLGQWIRRFLADTRPDIVHVNSGYLLGGAVPQAAHDLGIPTVLTLHDYWYLCPMMSLLRQDGRICHEPVPPERCAWCWLSQRRRYGVLDRYAGGRLGDGFVALSRLGAATRLFEGTPLISRMAERRAYLFDVFQNIDRVLSPSWFLIKKMDQYGFDAERIIHLPFGLSQNIAKVNRLRERDTAMPLRIGYLGQIALHKGVHLLVKAFRRLSGAPDGRRLVLHGRLPEGTPYSKRLRRMAGGDEAITFAGPYPNERVGQVLSELDVVVVPSIWYENRPTVIIEAFAHGVPVVAARLGGMAELIDDGRNGLLFDPGDADSLRAQLQRLLDEPDLLARLRRGIPPVPTPEEEMLTLVSLYEDLL
ncbi:MAG: glycosyltransferase family 4 protein [Anaerolineae bacterium]|jgi:glycosyltransferase involved in cell wall biosynthesis